MTLCCASLVVLPAGCGSRAATPDTALTMLAVNPSVGRAAFHLTCAPPGGDLADPATACRAIAARPELVTRPTPFVCYGGTTSWWDITIAGRLHGRRVHAHIATCWTPQMATIRRLGVARALRMHLLPRRQETVLPGVPRSFPSGTLRPGDLVTCHILGHELDGGVPIEYTTSGTGYGGKNVTSVFLSISRRRDGSVTASCHMGSA